MTFQVITKDELSAILNLRGKALDDLLSAKGWTVSSDEVRLPSLNFGHPLFCFSFCLLSPRLAAKRERSILGHETQAPTGQKHVALKRTSLPHPLLPAAVRARRPPRRCASRPTSAIRRAPAPPPFPGPMAISNWSRPGATGPGSAAAYGRRPAGRLPRCCQPANSPPAAR